MINIESRFLGFATAYAGTILLAACTAGPDYMPPADEVGPAFVNRQDLSTSQPESLWWTTFGDNKLSALIDEALMTNHDLRVAQANVTAARAFLREDSRDLYPTVTVQGNVNRENPSAESAGPGDSATYYDAGFDAFWELDFFGRVRRNIEASNADFEAALAEQRDITVIVAAEVARTFIELRGFQYQLDVARRNEINQQQTYDLTTLLLEEGRGTQLDVSRAASQLETTRASIPPLEAAVARNMHRLAVLVGRQPTALTETLAAVAPLPDTPIEIAIGDPAGMLRRRPDIRAAEQRLAASTARVGVATAELFPKVSILGSAGYLATSANSFSDGRSQHSSVGTFLRWPAFDLGRVRARIQAADANADGYLALYEQTVLRALEEAENSLVAYSRTQSRQESLRLAAEASEQAVKLARMRYQNGVDSFLTVLDAERRLFESQSLLAIAETDSLLAYVSLYKALGGGWES